MPEHVTIVIVGDLLIVSDVYVFIIENKVDVKTLLLMSKKIDMQHTTCKFYSNRVFSFFSDFLNYNLQIITQFYCKIIVKYGSEKNGDIAIWSR